MRSYEAARSLFSFLAFIAWSVVVIGVLVAFISAAGVSQYAGGGAGLLAMVPGVGIAIAGFIQVAFIQMGRATVDTAEYTQQMLKIARDQLEVSRQAINSGGYQSGKVESVKVQKNQKSGFKKIDLTARTKTNDREKIPPAIQKTDPVMIEGEKLEYLGHTITRKNGMYMTSGMSYVSLLYAKTHIENKQKKKV